MTKKKKNNTAKIAWAVFMAALIASLAAEFLMHPHATFGIEGTRFFNAWFGFAACAAIVIVSKLLGIFLKRKEGYYKEAKDGK